MIRDGWLISWYTTYCSDVISRFWPQICWIETQRTSLYHTKLHEVLLKVSSKKVVFGVLNSEQKHEKIFFETEFKRQTHGCRWSYCRFIQKSNEMVWINLLFMLENSSKLCPFLIDFQAFYQAHHDFYPSSLWCKNVLRHWPHGSPSTSSVTYQPGKSGNYLIFRLSSSTVCIYYPKCFQLLHLGIW